MTLTVTEPGRRAVWQPPASIEIASGSRPGVVHTCTRQPDGSWTCSCEDNSYRGNVCKHILKARIQWGEVENIDVGELL